MFHALHPKYPGNTNFEFRLRLLKFIILFTTRSTITLATPSKEDLQSLRNRHHHHAAASPLYNSFIESLSTLDISAPQSIAKSLSNSYDDTPTKLSANENGMPNVLTLLDTIPFFMALSAAQIMLQARDTRITEVWMKLAAGYMAHATIEQYLQYGAEGDWVFRQAFAWGFDPDLIAEEGSDEFQVNAMFMDEDGGSIPKWEIIRKDHMLAVRMIYRTISIAHIFPRNRIG